MSQVKGLAFRSVLHAHAALRGNDSLEQVHALLGADLSGQLRFVVASSWYPLASYVHLWNAIQHVSGDDDYPRLVGRRCVDQDLKLVHRLAFAALSTATVIDISARLFGSYYDVGTCASRKLEPHRVEVSFQNCVGFSTPMWSELRGAIEMFAELSSHRTSQSRLIRGGKSGDPTCVIEVLW